MFTIDGTTMTRSSSETAFVRFDDPDYYVYPLTMALKVLFNDARKATSVLVNTAGAEYTISARKEIILSAGVIGSAQLLQVSGVGDAKALQALNIDVVADLPGVGQNMQDHIVFGVTHGVNVVTSSAFGNPDFAAKQAQLFDQSASGLLTNPTADLLAWEKLPNKTRSMMSNSTLTSLAKYPADWPELEYIALSAYLGNTSMLSTSDPLDGIAYASLGVVLCTPQSRGTVTITSANATVAPAINPGFLTHKADIEVAVGGFKRAREFWASSSLDQLRVGPEVYPGPSVVSDAQIENAIRQSFQTIFHGSSTCAMGKPDDPNAVVDTQARVYGVKGLRVVDAAAFTFLPPGHPQSTVCK